MGHMGLMGRMGLANVFVGRRQYSKRPTLESQATALGRPLPILPVNCYMYVELQSGSLVFVFPTPGGLPIWPAVVP